MSVGLATMGHFNVQRTHGPILGGELPDRQKMARKQHQFCDNICMVFERKDGVCVTKHVRMGALNPYFRFQKKRMFVISESSFLRNGRAP